jgi:nicotinamidase/pyrazinamidase
MTALLLVDLQNDFMPGGALEVKEGDQVLPIVNALLEMPFQVVIASKDWHPQDHISFASTTGKKVGDTVEVEGNSQILWPDHCIQGTKGAKFYPGWDVSKVNAVFLKGVEVNVDSYSIFFDNCHARDTGLEEYLKKKGIHTVYIAGLATDYCVKYSALDAKQLGFHVNVVLDGCKGVGLYPEDVIKAVEEMKGAGVRIRHLEELRGGGI